MPVTPKGEPADFDDRVRRPGAAFLAATPQPTPVAWRNHRYWLRSANDLADSYDRICAYSCHWIPNTDGRSVEHFRPKSLYPPEAYEWSNYRLVFGVLNGCKGDNEDVLDPFVVQEGWFVIEFPSLLIKPGAGLHPDIEAAVWSTCDRLHLNAEDKCLKDRFHYLQAYCLGGMTFEFLSQSAPFLARELVRQGLRDLIPAIMNFPPPP